MELVLDLLRMSAIRLILARDFIRTQSKPNRVLGLKKKNHFVFTCRAMGQLD